MSIEEKKPEHMTALSGNCLVPKYHARIAFRGKIDTLEAEVIEAQVLAAKAGEGEFCGFLGEVLEYLRAIMAAEVKEKPLAALSLFGMDADEIHRKSHNIKGKTFKLPSYTQGPIAARINTLRAKVREVELLAVKVFGPKEKGAKIDVSETDSAEREDIILAMNRLSSALWWLFCEYNQRKE